MIRAALIGVVLAIIYKIGSEPEIEYMLQIALIFLFGGLAGILLVIDLIGGKR
tara:strand:- start:408 stop:566 length:159 start_codon:yes stop_codon:yes gene_type:complete